jgi:hypothetical protein
MLKRSTSLHAARSFYKPIRADIAGEALSRYTVSSSLSILRLSFDAARYLMSPLFYQILLAMWRARKLDRLPGLRC